MTVCCHKFQPAYLAGTRHNILMDLVVYDKTLILGDASVLVGVLPSRLDI